MTEVDDDDDNDDDDDDDDDDDAATLSRSMWSSCKSLSTTGNHPLCAASIKAV